MPKKGTPIPPNYKKVIRSIHKTGRVAKKQQQKQLKWANQFYKDAQALNKDVIADLDVIRSFQLSNAQKTRARYEEVFEPLEDEQIAEINQFQGRVSDFDEEVQKLKDEAIAWKSEANQRYQAAKSQANVHQAFSQEKQAAERALLDAGVNPNSGAAMALNLGADVAEGAAKAAAGTQAADATRIEGDARMQGALDRQVQATTMAEGALRLQGGMVDIGRQYPGQVAAEAGQAATAGAQAIDQTVGIADATARQKALALQWGQQRLDSMKTWVDALNTGFTNKLDLYNAETERQKADAADSSGIGGFLGVAGAALKAFANKGGLIEAFEGGGMPTGTTATASAPAVGGDDPDIIDARLARGEFVIPSRVVAWKGEEFFQNLIDKAPKEKQELVASTGAVPSIKAVPQAGALAI